MDRRDLMMAALASGTSLLMPSFARAAAQQGAGDRAFLDVLRRIDSPDRSGAWSIGMDDRDAAAMARRLASKKQGVAAIEVFDPHGLSANLARFREILLYRDRAWIAGMDRFGLDDLQRPFVITHQGGAYFTVPDFLDAVKLHDASDAEAYLERVRAFAVALDRDSERQAAEAGRGYLAPRFSLDLAIAQMVALRAPGSADNRLTRSLVRRTAGVIPGDWGTRCAVIVEAVLYPALDRQIVLMRRLSATARTSAGVWDVPDGAALYAAALEDATTLKADPAELNRLGLSTMAEIGAELSGLLAAQGLTHGAVGERLLALSTRPALVYPDTAAGRAEILRDAEALHGRMRARLRGLFDNPPDTPLRIEPAAADIEDGAETANYFSASFDGSRPARLRLNLKALAGSPRYALPVLIYHEGLPGHHLQKSCAQGAMGTRFTAYAEGWALHAEALAGGLGGYATPLERIGYLQSRLVRAVRMVVDTGLHARRWSAEQATAYFASETGVAATVARREVNRYCVRPGQACSYMVGYRSWARSWDAARRILGTKFHADVFRQVLEAGEMPLPMLERLVEEHARRLA